MNTQSTQIPPAKAVSSSVSRVTILSLLSESDAEGCTCATFCDWGDRLGWYFTYDNGVFACWDANGMGIMSPDENEVIAHCYRNAQVRDLRR